ncbi:protein PHLOEM UNLOADING MODULATOR isoform X2 [Telopea speciosissima]|uniref:protein PHLOEM UNLOADING MODULATOR isoform X2 n=1 Tax=Telopea speciosissima TaxID=54955 RepID=UPI001CC4BC4D|nr:protein PHLOEM UNLOADING MODULATOR isoform X2 [Telopea speciosissima]
MPLPAWAASMVKNGGLGLVALTYVGVDYLRHLTPSWHARLQPALWVILILASLTRFLKYPHWNSEIRSAIPFIASMLFLLSAFLFEVLSVRFVTAVLGIGWHRATSPLPDTGQWLLLALNEKLPHVVVEVLRARIISLHHYLMLFVMLAFSVLFNSVKAPGLGLGARYMFTMAVGRLLRVVSFVSTILPAVRPWCVSARYRLPSHPHPWAQKYYVPYASDAGAISELVQRDMANADVGDYIKDYRPDWGSMSFLINFLRPTRTDGSWYSLLKRASGGCNDLLYSGHMLVAVLTAMAWTEAYGGWTSAILWMLVIHSAQREIRERNHYSVDCVVAIYVAILLWKMTGFIWSPKDTSLIRKLAKYEKIHSQLNRAIKDSDMDEVMKLLKEVESAGQQRQSFTEQSIQIFAYITIVFTISIVILAFIVTSDG